MSSAQKKWIIMEVYLICLKKVKNKQDYVDVIFPFFIRSLNDGTAKFNQFRNEQSEKLEYY